MAIELTSPAFHARELIPRKYTGEGEDASPPLSWAGLPEGTNELALICDDPDAPTANPFVHWVAYKIPPHQTDLPENNKGGIAEGKNDFGRIGYAGPMPPKGHGVHHYHFRVYALDQPLHAGPGLTKDQLVKAMQGHILDEGELIGIYERA